MSKFGYVISPQGSMQTGVPYKIQDEGYDYYLFSNGICVSKDLVEFRGREREEDDYYLEAYKEMMED